MNLFNISIFKRKPPSDVRYGALIIFKTEHQDIAQGLLEKLHDKLLDKYASSREVLPFIPEDAVFISQVKARILSRESMEREQKRQAAAEYQRSTPMMKRCIKLTEQVIEWAYDHLAEVIIVSIIICVVGTIIGLMAWDYNYSKEQHEKHFIDTSKCEKIGNAQTRGSASYGNIYRCQDGNLHIRYD